MENKKILNFNFNFFFEKGREKEKEKLYFHILFPINLTWTIIYKFQPLKF